MKNPLRSLFPAVVASTLAGPLEGQDVDALARALADHPAIPGAAVGWVEAEASAMAVAGLRSFDGDPVQLADAWHLGSIGKSMTGFQAARMVADGRISWDMRVSGEDGPSLAELLRHTSGLPANPPWYRYRLLPRDPGPTAQAGVRAQLVDAALRRRDPDQGFLYSNLGYITAGHMLAAPSGTDWETLIMAELFEPFNLHSAGFGAPPAILGHTARGHALQPGPRADNPPAFGPAGRVHMAPEDILTYLRLHLLRDPDVLPETAWRRLHEPLEGEAFGMGWMQREDGSIWHNGSNTYWYAEAFVDHATGRAGFVAVNSGNLPVVAPLVGEVLAALNPR